MAVTYSSLSTNSKNVYNRLHCWAITKVAIALHERKTANAMQLSRESGIEFPKLIDNCDVALLCQEELRTDTPLPDDIMAIKGLLKAIYDTENGGDKIWKKWTDYKHIFRNYYRPYFIIGSGMNEDDAILLAAKHHWAYKKNKNIKVHNNKCLREGKPDQQKAVVSDVDAPDNLNQSGELYPEAIAYLLFRNHPIFQPDLSSKTPNNSSPNNDFTPDNDDQSVEGEELTLRQRMTSKGFFKSRNTQRAEELNRKNKKSKCNAYSNDVIDLTKEKTEVAREHVQAARSQVEMMKYQCKLSAINHAIKVGINVDRLRPCVETTLEDLFPGVMKPSANRESPSKMIVLLDKEQDASDEEAGDGTTTRQTQPTSPAKEATVQCAAGKKCKEPNVPMTDTEFKCSVCKQMSHQHCLGDICQVGYLCLPCALE